MGDCSIVSVVLLFPPVGPLPSPPHSLVFGLYPSLATSVSAHVTHKRPSYSPPDDARGGLPQFALCHAPSAVVSTGVRRCGGGVATGGSCA
ncbi:unnamed protein product [Closterium sp. Naga37s-1]|nr:unnamed protein product [Closterium sp. Naga37s-1]CAI5525528.1 unnamed protein product [Closterium sp. Naga37s-1]